MASTRTTKARFLRLLCGSLLASFAAVALFNAAVDPYGIFGSPTMPGVNALKPRPDAWLGEIKQTVAEKRAPDGLILGNPRAEVGFDPNNASLQARKVVSYNMAVPGL